MTKPAERESNIFSLPADFTLKSAPKLASVFRKFMHQSGTEKNLINIASAQVLIDFRKAKLVTGLMLE